jgi:hypothetical protein
MDVNVDVEDRDFEVERLLVVEIEVIDVIDVEDREL